MKPWAKGLVFASAAILGGVIGYLIVWALTKSCVLFPAACSKILFRRGPGTTLQVTDPRTGYMYYYDGKNIHSYGDSLPGVCPSILAQGATGQLGAMAPVIAAPCLKWSPDGKICLEQGATPVTPQKFVGSVVAKGDIYQPGFTLDAATMKLHPGVTCVRNQRSVDAMFRASPTESIALLNRTPLDIYQVFDVLKARGIFKV